MFIPVPGVSGKLKLAPLGITCPMYGICRAPFVARSVLGDAAAKADLRFCICWMLNVLAGRNCEPLDNAVYPLIAVR
jgi:hypothetical protein